MKHQRPSRLLKLLAEGQIAKTLKINLSDPRVIEIAGLSGLDGVWICNEHVPNDWIGLENMIRAARVHDMDSFVRVAKGSYSDYVKPFEADATGIIVPHVETEEEARQIVDWVRFYPQGKRALDGGNTDGQFCLMPMENYLEYSNREKVVILQIESPEGLENVEKIAAVPGFNGILFGPGDFSHRIGKTGQLDDPQVVAARKRVAAAALKNGKFAMAAGLIAPFDELIADGIRVFNTGSDVVALGAYMKQRLELFQEHIEALPSELKPSTRSPYV